ncbi:MAG: UDP-N-acetylglucosamine 1-carboxyvinyltransferase [Romboutsia sp.]|nr:UDP-N-acetylglucosamine 1-carboxyvinyltransferase [Romboutsia sp.]
MSRDFKVYGNQVLKGEVTISGAKNATLPIIGASLICNGVVTLRNVPNLADVKNMFMLIEDIGGTVQKLSDGVYKIDARNIKTTELNQELSTKLRASILFLGGLIARFNNSIVYQPGGCKIGTRPIDLHLVGLEKMGCEVDRGETGCIKIKSNELNGCEICLDFPSVGATENIMTAAVLAKGRTILVNAAQEPEIEDLANFLNSMGAKISGAGTNKIIIDVVTELKNETDYTIMSDRIEAGTFLMAAAMNPENKVIVRNVNLNHLAPVVSKMENMGVEFKMINNTDVEVVPPKILKPLDVVQTMPYPGFPTDLQPQMMTLLCKAEGTTVIKETIFENRLHHVGELKKMGASIVTIDNHSATVKGNNELKGSTLKCFDLRAGISMIIAAINANGSSVITDTHHIRRGYENIIEKLESLGVKIEEL